MIELCAEAEVAAPIAMKSARTEVFILRFPETDIFSIREQRCDGILELLLPAYDADLPIGADDVGGGQGADAPALELFKRGPTVDGLRPAFPLQMRGDLVVAVVLPYPNRRRHPC